MKSCECGCGCETNIAKHTDKRWGHVAGQPVRFLRGHAAKGRRCSDQTREKIGLAHKGKKLSIEQRTNHSQKMTGKNHPKWKSGRNIDNCGYVRVWVGRGHPMAIGKTSYAREHRLVMSRVLGRPLSKREIVRPINGVKTDNRPQNLQIFEGFAEHSSLHRRQQCSMH